MANKIFLSYRREDSAASALSIGQYLEQAFGTKNVFIDVDMRAGAKFPKVLAARLAECKVMLVLIGPDWVDAQDQHRRRRLEDPDDWVRLVIAEALKRNITVIPVRINGTELPSRTELPEEIKGVLDHQATSVRHSSFRHDMSGLVRDIRSIQPPGLGEHRRRLLPDSFCSSASVFWSPLVLKQKLIPNPTMRVRLGLPSPGNGSFLASSQSPSIPLFLRRLL